MSWALIGASAVLLANSSGFWKHGFRPWGARYLADRSYSLYLLHVEAFVLLKQVPGLPFPVYLALVWMIALGLAELLYRGVERPFMQTREWFAASRAVRPPAAPVGAMAAV